MFGIPVRVHPLFWLISAILGFDWQRVGFQYLVMWVVLVFVSILVHELGHVFAGRLFGADGHIVLYSFGGLAIGSSDLRRWWQRLIVYFAGPLAQFILYGLVWLFQWWLLHQADPQVLARVLTPPVIIGMKQLLWINWAWPLLNLLPIWPLDGGKISRELLELFMPGRGTRTALGVSLVVAGAMAANALIAMNREPLIPYLPTGGWYMVLLFGMLALGSYQAMQQVSVDNPW